MASMGEAGSFDGAKVGAVDQSRREDAEYISDLVRQLSAIARRSGLPLLSFMLDLAGFQAKTDAQAAADAVRKRKRAKKSSS